MESADVAVGVIIALIIAAIIFSVSGKASNSAISDHSSETVLVALGIRNNMIYILSSDRGTMNYKAPGGEMYDVAVSGDKISVTYSGMVIKASFKPTVELFHYMPKAAETNLISDEFCIVKKQDEKCNTYVAVCAAGDMACCKMEACGG